MERLVEGIRDPKIAALLNFSEFYLTTRFLPPPIYKSTPLGVMSSFAGMVVGDIFLSPLFVVYEKGTYDLYIECQTTRSSGNVVFSIRFGEIIGFVNFYSYVENTTIKAVEGIVFTGARKISIQGVVDSGSPGTNGFNIIIGKMWLAKRE